MMKKTLLALGLALATGTCFAASENEVQFNGDKLKQTHSAEAMINIVQDLDLYTEIQTMEVSSTIGKNTVVALARIGGANKEHSANQTYLGVGGYNARTELDTANQKLILTDINGSGHKLSLQVESRTPFTYLGEDKSNSQNILVFKNTEKLTQGSYTTWLPLKSPETQTNVSGTYSLKSFAYVFAN